MSEVREKTVKFSLADPEAVPAEVAENVASGTPNAPPPSKTTTSPTSAESGEVRKDEGSTQVKEVQAVAVEKCSSNSSTPKPPALVEVDIAKASAERTTILKNRIGAPTPKKFVFCDECKQEIPIEDWPDHRDRLRKVTLSEQVSTFPRTLVQLLGEFLMWIMRSVYFREVTVVGAENIPAVGAVVFYGNHQNQFIDALMMNSIVTRSRQVRFIMAEKSYNQPIIGQFGRMFNAVPVVRPQDVPMIPGEGRLVKSQGTTICGEGTDFTKCVAKGDVIVWFTPAKAKCSAQVNRIVSPTQVEVTMPIQTEFQIGDPTEFKISRRIDHSEMYAKVYDTLQHNQCIGIFPEGGSHDHTSLLPLKAGVALFSLGAAERNISVKIVPVGLTYFYGHKFRSRAYVEFGEPITPPEELVTLFSSDKRKATGIFLQQLNEALRAVTINVPDWKTLKFLHTFRQLYQPPQCNLSARDYLRLIRRLGVVIEQQQDNPEFMEFRASVENYSDYCNALLVRDSQAATLKRLGAADGEAPEIRLLLRRVFTLFLMGVILVPFFVVGLPIGMLIKYVAIKKTREALSHSSVKIVGADVTGSYKVLLGFAVVPVAFLVISLLVFFFTDARTTLVTLFCLPMAMYVSLLILQEAIMELRAALPLLMSLVSNHKQFKKLYEKRETLAAQAREVVHRYDPQLEKEMEVYTSAVDSDEDLEREPSLFSLRYSVRRRQAKNA